MAIQKWSDRIWIAKLGEGSILLDDMNSLLDEISNATPLPQLVLDFSCVQQINSSNLSQLLRLRKLAIEQDAKLLLVAIDNSLWAVFLMTGLDQLFQFAPDVSTALASLQLGQG